MNVPALSMVFMSLSAAVSIGVPFLLFALVRRRYSYVSQRPAWVGVAAFVISVLVVEAFVHFLVFKQFALIDKTQHPFVYMLYGALMAGVFEETARWLSFRWLSHRYGGSVTTGLSYGIGHGGSEAVLLAGIPMLGSIVLSFVLNSDAASTLPSSLLPISEQLASTAPYMFLISGGERLLAMVIQISLSVLVFYSVFRMGKWWLFPVAIVLHALTDCVPALTQAGIITNLGIVYGWLAMCATGLGYVAYRMIKDEEEEFGR
jgi:uncharacterized membrane protein YhfC